MLKLCTKSIYKVYVHICWYILLGGIPPLGGYTGTYLYTYGYSQAHPLVPGDHPALVFLALPRPPQLLADDGVQLPVSGAAHDPVLVVAVHGHEQVVVLGRELMDAHQVRHRVVPGGDCGGGTSWSFDNDSNSSSSNFDSPLGESLQILLAVGHGALELLGGEVDVAVAISGAGVLQDAFAQVADHSMATTRIHKRGAIH